MPQQTSRLKGIIESFIDDVFRLKGNNGRISIHIEQWLEAHLGTRDVVAATPPSPDLVNTRRKTTENQSIKTLQLGSRYRIQVHLPADGFLYLFNFGTSGTCKRLLPLPQEKWYATARSAICIPFSNGTMGVSFLTVLPPITDQTGLPERLFAVLTTTDLDLRLADLDPNLVERPSCSPIESRGFSGPPRINRPKLFTLAADDWEYGLLELRVME